MRRFDPSGAVLKLRRLYLGAARSEHVLSGAVLCLRPAKLDVGANRQLPLINS
jgi:hypothetical protein